MKLIPLTQGQFAKVDDEDFVRFGRLRWYAAWNPYTKSFYAQRMDGLGENGKRKTQLLHRAILGLTRYETKGDHINHDTLDNQRCNLRSCTNTQNLMNRRGPQRGTASGTRGVSWHKRLGWAASIRVKGKLMHLGYHATVALASDAYVAANKKYFGEFGGIA